MKIVEKCHFEILQKTLSYLFLGLFDQNCQKSDILIIYGFKIKMVKKVTKNDQKYHENWQELGQKKCRFRCWAFIIHCGWSELLGVSFLKDDLSASMIRHDLWSTGPSNVHINVVKCMQ